MATKLAEVEFEQKSRRRFWVWADQDKLSEEAAARLKAIEGVDYVSDWFTGKTLVPPCSHGEVGFDPRYDFEELKDEVEAVLLRIDDASLAALLGEKCEDF